MNKRAKNPWAIAQGAIMKHAFDLFGIDRADFADAVGAEEVTVRQWQNGGGFPRLKNYPDFYGVLKRYLDNIDDGTLHAELSDFAVATLQPLGIHGNPYMPSKETIGDYLVKIFRICYANRQNSGVRPIRHSDGEHTNRQATGQVKAVVFDFDGTLTFGSAKTTWETIWTTLGYSEDDCEELHHKFSSKEITHKEWCSITAQKFKEKNLHKDKLIGLCKSIQLIERCKETFDILKNKSIKIFIVSGSIRFIIQEVLNGLIGKYVDEIKANDFLFDTNGFLIDIIGTEYDFEGKPKYIKEISDRLKISTKDVVFVGNSRNDCFAYQSGAKTLCINPRLTNPDDQRIWSDCIPKCSSLVQILQSKLLKDSVS